MRFFTPFFFLLTLISGLAFGQSHVKIMQYNLLYYGNEPYVGCNPQNNNTILKNGYLHAIIEHVKPSILTVNELRPYDTKADSLLNGALNVNGATYWKRANVTGSYIGNMIFYDSRVVKLYSQDIIGTDTRVTDVYKMYYNSPDVASLHDTAFFYCIVCHLKAGYSSSDEVDRAGMTAKIMQYLADIGSPDNYLLMGDMNLYSSSESAYQNLINYSNQTLKFNDPINMPGSWSGSQSYSSIHTQSTHASSGDCPVGGGMDDRFDFILASDFIMTGANKVTYVAGSYEAVGQDGQHLNLSINSGTNSAVPSNIADALYNFSDHLPVTLLLGINQTPATGISEPVVASEISFNNPVDNDLHLRIERSSAGEINIDIINMLGQIVYKNNVSCVPGTTDYTLGLDHLIKGIYFIELKEENNQTTVRKFVKR